MGFRVWRCRDPGGTAQGSGSQGAVCSAFRERRDGGGKGRMPAGAVGAVHADLRRSWHWGPAGPDHRGPAQRCAAVHAHHVQGVQGPAGAPHRQEPPLLHAVGLAWSCLHSGQPSPGAQGCMLWRRFSVFRERRSRADRSAPQHMWAPVTCSVPGPCSGASTPSMGAQPCALLCAGSASSGSAGGGWTRTCVEPTGGTRSTQGAATRTRRPCAASC